MLPADRRERGLTVGGNALDRWVAPGVAILGALSFGAVALAYGYGVAGGMSSYPQAPPTGDAFFRLDSTWYTTNKPVWVASANDSFYVDAGATGPGTGTSADPWITLDSANNRVAAGDVVFLADTFPDGECINPGGTTCGTATGLESGNVANGYIRYTQWSGQVAARVIGGSVGNEYAPVNLNGQDSIWIDSLSLTPRGTTNGNQGVHVQNAAKYNVFVGNTIDGEANGILVDSAQHTWIEGNTFLAAGDTANNTSDLVFIQESDSTVIYRNTFYNAGHTSITDGGYQSAGQARAYGTRIAFNTFRNRWSGGINVNGKSRQNIVEGNELIDIALDGLSGIGSQVGIFVAGDSGTYRYNRQSGGWLQCFKLQSYRFAAFNQEAVGNHIHNNTCTGVRGEGMRFVVQGSGVDVDLEGNTIENNLFWANNTGDTTGLSTSDKEALGNYQTNWHSFSIWLNAATSAVQAEWLDATNDTIDDLRGNVIRNNIMSYSTADDRAVLIISDGAPQVAYTTWADFEAETFATGSASGSVEEQDPLFVSTDTLSAFWLAITGSSPAIDAGFATAGLTFLGSGVDIGVYEAN